MVKRYSIAEAKNNFTNILHEAEEGTRVELTREGKTVAVLTGTNEFERMAEEAPSFKEAYEKFRREYDLVELNIDPDEVFADVRDPKGTILGKMGLGREDRDRDTEEGTILEIAGQGSEDRDHPRELGTELDSETGSGLSGEKVEFGEAYQEFRRRLDRANVEIDPDEIWGDVRDPSPGRDFEW